MPNGRFQPWDEMGVPIYLRQVPIGLMLGKQLGVGMSIPFGIRQCVSFLCDLLSQIDRFIMFYLFCRDLKLLQGKRYEQLDFLLSAVYLTAIFCCKCRRSNEKHSPPSTTSGHLATIWK
jgi:hypothetical protein